MVVPYHRPTPHVQYVPVNLFSKLMWFLGFHFWFITREIVKYYQDDIVSNSLYDYHSLTDNSYNRPTYWLYLLLLGAILNLFKYHISLRVLHVHMLQLISEWSLHLYGIFNSIFCMWNLIHIADINLQCLKSNYVQIGSHSDWKIIFSCYKL